MKNNKGFTLIELLVVIAIIGLLSSLAVVSLNGARGKARDAKRINDVKQLSLLIEMEAANSATGGYGLLPAACNTAGNLTTACGIFGGHDWSTMVDPSLSDTGCNGNSLATCAYSIGIDSQEGDYQICFYLEEGVANLVQGINHVSKGGVVSADCDYRP